MLYKTRLSSGLVTYYSTTKPPDKSWHVLELGYNPSICMDEIRNAAVVHFNSNMKTWFGIAMTQFKPLWTKYVDYELELFQTCILVSKRLSFFSLGDIGE
ncbi:Galacturonosyltransferase 8 [Spatholobus suberectus]|nr:Galacturonosyltransferase 8 [Spatholobus suberectus]